MCFDKKFRYINRKKLVERRPRVRGQFVRLTNSIEVDLNGQPIVDDYDGDEEEDASFSLISVASILELISFPALQSYNFVFVKSRSS